MLGLLYALSVFALQIRPRLIYQPQTLSSSSMFQGISECHEYTLTMWFSSLDSSSSPKEVLQVSQASRSDLMLIRLIPSKYSICIEGVCADFNASIEAFNWYFLSLSLNKSGVRVCTGEWLPRSLACSSVEMTTRAFTKDSSISSSLSASNEVYDLQLHFKALSTVEASTLFSSYSCNSVCVSCNGPSPTACSDFVPLVRLTETLALSQTDSVDYNKSDYQFRGREFTSVTSLATTGWYKVTDFTSSGDWMEVFRLWTQNTNTCPDSDPNSVARGPALFVHMPSLKTLFSADDDPNIYPAFCESVFFYSEAIIVAEWNFFGFHMIYRQPRTYAQSHFKLR
mmetsp:Transcript_34646/g.60927  ORF Transcript_34646/g.60927 Transcript_34646/m.60927 type:complete len:340 (+) Transcript_34646:12-1031(+)